ncbi:hypothetical protein L7F22_058021 [Adiantum nelumboides]|nr:hypothetical protein [Adiantum nelumboides]
MAWTFPKATSSSIRVSSSTPFQQGCHKLPAFRKADRSLRAAVSDTSQWRSFSSHSTVFEAFVLAPKRSKSLDDQVIVKASSSESLKQTTATAPDPSDGYLVPGVMESAAGLPLDELENDPEKLSEKIQSLKEQNENLRLHLTQGDSVPKVVPPPGDGQKIYELDSYLKPYRDHLNYRYPLYLFACCFYFVGFVLVYPLL